MAGNKVPQRMDGTAKDQIIADLHRAHCIIGLVSRAALDEGESFNPVLAGETLAAAEDLIDSAIERVRS